MSRRLSEGVFDETVLPARIGYPSVMSSRAETGRKRGDLGIALQGVAQRLRVAGVLPAVLVDRDEQRREGPEVHQQIVDDDPHLAETSAQLGAQHHAVHAAERVVRHEQVAAVGGQAVEPLRTVTDPHVRERGPDEADRVEVRIAFQDAVDLVLVDRPLQVRKQRSRQPAGQRRILVANDPFQIDLQAIFFGHIEDGLYGKGSNSRVFPCICPKSSYI